MQFNYKVNICFFLVIASLFISTNVFAFTASEVINYQAPEAVFYRQTFDNLVLDIKIPSGITGGSDVLKATVFKSDGNVFDATDFTYFTLWVDDGAEPGFQGLGVDKKLGALVFNPNNYTWYLSGLSQEVSADGLRLFVSVEVPSYATVNRFFKMGLSASLDGYNNCQYDLGDSGVFLQSCNNGPTDAAVVNTAIQIINAWSVDSLAPKAVITSPLPNQTIATSSYVVFGLARDQGNSVINKVEIGIINMLGHSEKAQPNETVWQPCQITESALQEKQWQYNWQDIAEGEYILKVRASDVNFGSAESQREVAVKVDFPEALPEPQTPETPTTPQEPDVPKTKTEQIADLQAQIQQIQLQIISLLSRLIQLLQGQL